MLQISSGVHCSPQFTGMHGSASPHFSPVQGNQEQRGEPERIPEV